MVNSNTETQIEMREDKNFPTKLLLAPVAPVVALPPLTPVPLQPQHLQPQHLPTRAQIFLIFPIVRSKKAARNEGL